MTGLDQDKLKHTAPIDRVGYSPKELENWHYIVTRLQKAKEVRDSIHEQFDGMTFMQYLENNERMWNATIVPKSDPMDWRSRARKRTVFQKGWAIIGQLNDENFITEFSAYDENNELDVDLGNAMTHAVQYTNDIEHGEEIDQLADTELLKHGFVALQEVFEVSDRTIKELDKVDWSVGVAADKRTWKTKTIPYKRQCVKKIIRPDSLYLGNIFEHDFTKQPYRFVRTVKSFEEARSVFGNWSRWKHVRPGYGGALGEVLDRVPYLDQWRLSDIMEDEVEIIEYLDIWNDEYQIFINGIMMLPVGFPIPWDTKEDNITFRILYVISAHFAYGHGLCHVMRSNSEVRDFFMRYAVDKGAQDLLPPMVSKAKRILSKNVFMPGRWTGDVSPEDIKPLIQSGLPSSTMQLIQYFEEALDADSISPIVAGQEGQAGQTAFEVSNQLKMAVKALGPIIMAHMWMKRDCDMKRAQNILENLARPRGRKLDSKTKELLNAYERLVLEDVDLPDGSRGTHVIEFTDSKQAPNSLELLKKEIEAKKRGKTVKYSYVDAEFVRGVPHRFQPRVKSSPRKNSDTKKLMVGEYLDNLFRYFPTTANMETAQSEFAKAWEKDPQKTFTEVQPAAPEQGPVPPQGPMGAAVNSAAAASAVRDLGA